MSLSVDNRQALCRTGFVVYGELLHVRCTSTYICSTCIYMYLLANTYLIFMYVH